MKTAFFIFITLFLNTAIANPKDFIFQNRTNTPQMQDCDQTDWKDILVVTYHLHPNQYPKISEDSLKQLIDIHYSAFCHPETTVILDETLANKKDYLVATWGLMNNNNDVLDLLDKTRTTLNFMNNNQEQQAISLISNAEKSHSLNNPLFKKAKQDYISFQPHYNSLIELENYTQKMF